MTKRNIIFLICQSLVAIIGFVLIFIRRNDVLALTYILMMTSSIICLYFNYSLCKRHNRLHAKYHEKNPRPSEPSDFLLITSKISFWVVYVFGLVSALLNVSLL